jgi:hypothetical protein
LAPFNSELTAQRRSPSSGSKECPSFYFQEQFVTALRRSWTFGGWDLDFFWSLELEAWNFQHVIPGFIGAEEQCMPVSQFVRRAMGATIHRGWELGLQSSSPWPLRRASCRAHRGCFRLAPPIQPISLSTAYYEPCNLN